jgi:signal transduction histidine kinase
MLEQRKTRRPYRRVLLVYLIVIASPTLGFLYLGLESVQRQRQAITSLTLANLRLSGEQLATELERRAWHPAENCLRDEELGSLRVDRALTPEQARPIRDLLTNVEARHPIARQFFIWQDGSVRFPLLRSPPLPPLDTVLLPNEGKNDADARALSLLGEGEELELRQDRLEQAVSRYRQACELSVSDDVKALALARLARCFHKSNKPQEAEHAYAELQEKYGQRYDPFHRPYAVLAALEFGSLSRSPTKSSVAALVSLHRDLVQGRWELSADQLDYFLAAIEERVPAARVPVRDSAFLSHFDLARAVEARFRHYGPLRSGEVYAQAVHAGETDYQTFYRLLPGGPEREMLVGFAVNLDWLAGQLLPQLCGELPVADSVTATLGPVARAEPAANGPAATAAFKSLFPFWTLSVAPAPAALGQASARRDLVVFTGATLFVLCVLVLGVVLLLRDVWRQLALARLRADLVSSVSHELKTPLTLIRLYGETLVHGPSFTEEERQGFYEIIARESERLTHLIERVLDFSRIDRGEKEYRLVLGDLAPVVGRTVEPYRRYLAQQGFSVETEMAESLPPVRLDPDAVSQAVLNLLDNAAKYSGPSKFVAVRLYADPNNLVLEVEDRGLGIALEERDKIFEQFYRGSRSTAKGGYGLGLFLVKHIMDAHGGRIELDSEPGRGSRFRLLFPIPCTRS